MKLQLFIVFSTTALLQSADIKCVQSCVQWDKEFMPEDQLPQWLVQLTSKKAIDKYVNEAAILLQTIKPSVTSINFTSPHFK